MQLDVVWLSLAWPGTEYVRWTDHEGLRADGAAVHALPDGPLHVSYTVVTDHDGFTAQVAVELGRAGRLTLARDRAGRWRDGDGRHLPELDGCTDVDISTTPLTNTLPIRRLNLAPSQSAELDVVYLRMPDLRPTRARQHYTHLHHTTDSSVYRFESGSFCADLAVDPHGLVLEYPNLWRRGAITWKGGADDRTNSR